MTASDQRALPGAWSLGFAVAGLPILPWPFFALLTMLASSGASDPPTPEQVMGYVAVWLHTLYPLLFWLAWRGVRALRGRGRPVAAALLLALMPVLSAASIALWYTIGSIPGLA